MIIVDDREDKNRIMQLKAKGLPIEVQRLEVGDMLLPNDFAIESKTINDLLTSLRGRIWEQLNNLSENYKYPILAIISDNKWKSMYYNKSSYIDKSYAGFRATITTSYPKMKIEIFEDDDEFFDWLKRVYTKLIEEGHSSRPIPKLRKGKKLNIIQENIFAQIKGISLTKSKILLEYFGSVKNICNASIDEFKSINGIGNKLATNLYDTVNCRYQNGSGLKGNLQRKS